MGLVVAAGCGSSSNNNDAQDDAGDADLGDAPDGGGDAPPPDATPIEGELHELSVTIPNIQPGQEGTKCIWVRLDNAAAIKVRQVHNLLSSSSHHLIIYKDDMNTSEQVEPIDCSPFSGALNTTGAIAPIMITQKYDDLLTLPERVAYTLDATQMVKLEMHYQNATDLPLDAAATIKFYAVDPATIDHEADILFIGSPDIDLAPGATSTLNQFFRVPTNGNPNIDLSASKIFAITGHTHQYGTSVKVRVAPSATGPKTDVYDPSQFLWSEPPTENHTPGFGVPTGGGFDFECTWTNTSNQRVGFGEGVNDEMCFFWAYYYPSQGSRVCVHTAQFGGQDICCPGSALCSYLEDQF